MARDRMQMRVADAVFSRSTGAWRGFRSILCPIDFSGHSRVALRYAAAVAHRTGTSVTALHAVDPLLVRAAAAALGDRALVKRSSIELQRFVTRTLGPPSTPSPRVDCLVTVGSPADEILDVARRRRSDLIVVGTHGLTGATRLLAGSTTRHVLGRTTVPVLAIPRSARQPPRTSGEWPGALVAAAVDIDLSPDRQVTVAARVAQWFDSALLVFDRVDRLGAARPGLVMIRLPEGRGWLGAARGSAAYRLLSRAAIPILAYPPRWRPR